MLLDITHQNHAMIVPYCQVKQIRGTRRPQYAAQGTILQLNRNRFSLTINNSRNPTIPA
jgi:hypothetical protein